jgi:hypothetical protein
MNHPKRLIIPVIVLLLLIGLWSTQVLPGSIFYGYKVTVTEPVIKLLNFTQERRARYEVGLVEKRLAEIVQLTRENKVTDKAFNAWQGALIEKVYAVLGRVSSLQTESSILLSHAIATQQHAVLNGYVTGLPKVSASNTSDISKVLESIMPYQDEAKTSVTQTKELVLQLLDRQKYIGEIDGQINEVVAYADETKNMLLALEGKISKEDFINATAAQEAVEKQIFEAKERRARDFYPEAGLEIQEAHAASRQLRIMLGILKGN